MAINPKKHTGCPHQEKTVSVLSCPSSICASSNFSELESFQEKTLAELQGGRKPRAHCSRELQAQEFPFRADWPLVQSSINTGYSFRSKPGGTRQLDFHFGEKNVKPSGTDQFSSPTPCLPPRSELPHIQPQLSGQSLRPHRLPPRCKEEGQLKPKRKTSWCSTNLEV